MILLSHPTGNANVRGVLEGLLEANLLANFYTSIATFSADTNKMFSLMKYLPGINRREYDSRLSNITKTVPLREICRHVSMKLGIDFLTKHETGWCSVDAIYTALDKTVASNLNTDISGVYAYEDGALLSFQKAKRLGIKCLYDLPIGYWRAARRLLATEQERWPEWAATLTGFNDSPKKLERKDKELHLANHIFVASTFTANTLSDYPGVLSPISVVPYGFPAPYTERRFDSTRNRRLKLLFVGGLSQRKGLADLLAAVDNLGNEVELTIVGRKPVENCKALNNALKKYTWIPSLSHPEILKTMRQHDVLVFPSLFEGFGLVIAEAMSQGTPVITTDRTAGPDLIIHNQNGWIIKAGCITSLQQAIKHLLEHPDAVVNAGIHAITTAQRRSWYRYGQEMAHAVAAIQ